MYKFPNKLNLLARTGTALKRMFLSRKQSPEEEEEAMKEGDRMVLEGMSGITNWQLVELMEKVDNSMWKVKLRDGNTLTVRQRNLTSRLAECVIWDLPGIGTPSFPQGNYIKKMGIRHFDIVILMTASRFSEAELSLLKELKRYNVPYFLVRNKVDAAVQSEIEKVEEEIDDDLEDEKKDEVQANTVKAIKEWFSFNATPRVCIVHLP